MNLYYRIQSHLKLPIPIFFKKYLKKYFGKNELDKKLKSFLNFNNGFYIEIGAYDGITQSNTYYYEKNNNWKGILIEPSKIQFNKCKLYRSKKNIFYNCACVSFKFKKSFLKMNYSGLKTFSSIFLSQKKEKDYVKNPEIQRGEKKYSYYVKTITMNDILLKSNAPKIIDFLSLDTEGAEFEVLNGIDFNKFKFRYLLIETNNFIKLKKFMLDKNYKFIKKFNYNDYLFKL